jgi:hypothetical protein
MKAKRTWWVALALALGAGLGLLILALPGGRARAGDSGGGSPSQSLSAPSVFAAGPAMDGGVLNISGSSVEVAGFGCYETGKTQPLCFTVYNGSTDAEWLDEVHLKFPAGSTDWGVSCGTWDNVDSSGSPVNFACGSTGREVFFTDSDTESPPIGEISAGSSWGFCVQVTVPATGYTGPQPIEWDLSGDEDGAPEHDIHGETMIEECAALMLNPSSMAVEGCNGQTQTLTFELWDHHAGDDTFHLDYYAPESAVFTGPSDLYLTEGSVVTFTVELAPDRCLAPGDQVVASIEALGGSGGAYSTITHTVSLLSGWQTLPYTSPVPSMDSVVVWASHKDGGLWVIGGYGSNGATQRYDPGSGTWQTFESEAVITPLIEYPMDGCYGLDSDDWENAHEIVVLFPDTIVTDSLHVFDITAKSWYTRPIPTFFGPGYEGRWGYDVVSLFNNPSVKPGLDRNACYLSGGSTQVGGGRTRDLYVYYPDTNSGQYIGPPGGPSFPAEIWFGFHASWYVPWVGELGSICVGGGIDHNSQVSSARSTQCYDIAADHFNDADDDLGPLPEPWWGMADGWQIYQGQYQIWIANGVAQDGTLLPASAYASATSGGFQYGPDVPVGLYRVEGDGWVDSFYMIGGAKGGFNSSHYNQLLVQCPWCSETFLPLSLRNH